VVCPHVGCGFGCMGYGWPRSDGRIAWAMLLAAALAATVTCWAWVPCWPRWTRAFASLRRSVWARGFCDVQGARDKGTPCAHASIRQTAGLEVLWHRLAKGRAHDETVHLVNRNRAQAAVTSPAV
jgi:hypothetical protein